MCAMTKSRSEELAERAAEERRRCRDWLLQFMRGNHPKFSTTSTGIPAGRAAPRTFVAALTTPSECNANASRAPCLSITPPSETFCTDDKIAVRPRGGRARVAGEVRRSPQINPRSLAQSGKRHAAHALRGVRRALTTFARLQCHGSVSLPFAKAVADDDEAPSHSR